MKTNANLEVKIDRVCGMDLIGVADPTKISYQNGELYFCGEDCKKKFETNPEKFNGEPLIKLRNVWKIFGAGVAETQVLRGLNLHIWKGDFVAIIGASGSGKSTVLNMIGLLDTLTSGKILLDNKDVSVLDDEEKALLRSRTFGFVFQQYNLVPWLTAYENVSLPLIFAGRKVEANKLELDFEKIGLKNRSPHRPFELSGGEQQRVALLRALANNPEIIIGDEPTGNLDSATGNKILEMLIELNKIQGKTLIIVTHDTDIAEKADQIITIKDGQVARDHKIYKKIYTE